jgi:VanZ family protein
MALIFGGSTNVLSVQHTSRFLVPFLRWLKPNISTEAIKNIQTVIRKSGHMTEYAVLALLLFRAKRASRPLDSISDTTLWNPSDAAFAIGISALYAATDEFHQYFVATRQASLWDVLIDVCGASLAMLLLWLINRRWSRI